jgi:hypothetical protein
VERVETVVCERDERGKRLVDVSPNVSCLTGGEEFILRQRGESVLLVPFQGGNRGSEEEIVQRERNDDASEESEVHRESTVRRVFHFQRKDLNQRGGRAKS